MVCWSDKYGYGETYNKLLSELTLEIKKKLTTNSAVSSA